MYKIGQYKATDLMSDLICKNYPMLLVMSRFGIALGFGEDTIDTACRKNNVDTGTFLSVVNLLIGEEIGYRAETLPNISIPSLVEYLRNSHSYFLDFRLPSIKNSLINALSD
ncbi:MAG: hemerythrin domain-containing protein, partial [Paludibacteraceae bacterium]|nr:hemerythrin domain-containing protein [Paludibacteraceae bacterium]